MFPYYIFLYALFSLFSFHYIYIQYAKHIPGCLYGLIPPVTVLPVFFSRCIYTHVFRHDYVFETVKGSAVPRCHSSHALRLQSRLYEWNQSCSQDIELLTFNTDTHTSVSAYFHRVKRMAYENTSKTCTEAGVS